MSLPPIEAKAHQVRTALLLGKNNLEKLRSSHVLVLGLGGVGAYAAESLCRSGVGKMTIVDGDVVEPTNRNRQLPALISTENKPKALILAERFKDINPDGEFVPLVRFIRDEASAELLSQRYDYVVDAIDQLSPKVHFLQRCVELKYPLISSMGSGGRIDPAQIAITDISKTYNCALAKAVRKRLGKMEIKSGIECVFSPETVPESAVWAYERENGDNASMVGTISYIPAIFGCFCASVVIRRLCGIDVKHTK